MSSLGKIAADVRRLPRTMVEEAAERFDEVAKDVASRVVGPGARMRKPKRSIQLGTDTKITSTARGARAAVRGTPRGPWVWIEDGTEPHKIGKRGRFVYGKGMAHPLAAPVAHPGARGQQTWSQAVRTMDREVKRRADKTVERVVRRGR